MTRATRGPGLRLQCSLTRSADSNALGAGAPLHAARLIPTRLELRHRPGGEGLDRGVVGPHDARVGPHTHVRAVRARAGNRHPVRRRTSPDQTGACERANEDRPEETQGESQTFVRHGEKVSHCPGYERTAVWGNAGG